MIKFSWTNGLHWRLYTQIWMLLEPDKNEVNVEVGNYDNDKFRNYEFEVKNLNFGSIIYP